MRKVVIFPVRLCLSNLSRVANQIPNIPHGMPDNKSSQSQIWEGCYLPHFHTLRHLFLWSESDISEETGKVLLLSGLSCIPYDLSRVMHVERPKVIGEISR